MIEKIDQRRLAAKVNEQRFLFSACADQRCRHLLENVHISAAKTVDRLLAIADNKKVRLFASAQFQNELLEQRALQTIRVLKFVYQEKLVTLRRAAKHLWPFEKFERAQLPDRRNPAPKVFVSPR